MDVMQVFWLFFIVSALQPVLQRRYLEAMRTRKIAQIEKKRGSRVILLIHRQETMNLLGFPLMRYIDVNDSEEVLRAIQMTGDEVPLDIVLHTPGGLVLAATQIAQAIQGHKGKVTVFVPHYAMSGGTLIAIAADEIVMCRHSVLGPIDPQLGGMPAASIIKVAEEKPIAEVDDQTLVMADIGRKAITQVQTMALQLLAEKTDQDRARSLERSAASFRTVIPSEKKRCRHSHARSATRPTGFPKIAWPTIPSAAVVGLGSSRGSRSFSLRPILTATPAPSCHCSWISGQNGAGHAR